MHLCQKYSMCPLPWCENVSANNQVLPDHKTVISFTIKLFTFFMGRVFHHNIDE